MSYGRQAIGNASGLPIRVSADGSPEYKAGGVTLDWDTVDASAGETLTDGTAIPSGGQFIEYGTVLCRISASDKYGPYDSGASDGRQTLTRGECFILDETVIRNGALNISGLGGAVDHPAVFEGGMVYRDRLKIDASGTATKPSVADFNAAFPRIRYVNMDF